VVGYYAADGVVTDFEVVSESFDFDLGSSGDLSGETVNCPEGKLVTGGGASVLFTGSPQLDLKTSIPRGDLTGWSATVIAEDAPYEGTLNIYAICAAGVILATP